MRKAPDLVGDESVGDKARDLKGREVQAAWRTCLAPGQTGLRH